MRRRDFLAAPVVFGAFPPRSHAFSRFPVRYRERPAYLSALDLAEPGSDEFAAEKAAQEIETRLLEILENGTMPPLAANCRGFSPAPREYRQIAADVQAAVFDARSTDLALGWKNWRASLGTVRRARFFVLPGDLIRYEIRSENPGRLEHRVGLWKQSWSGSEITRFEPLEETVAHSASPWFEEVTGAAFSGVPSFHEQLGKGVPYWRSRLDPACGIDVYGENGVAVADIDQDGWDEIYVCQPGGLPNRLYKNDGSGRFRDISKEAGVDILDDTASALFVDLRNSGAQDLVLVRPTEPMLFLNDGQGRFTCAPNAFRFQSEPQGTFTSVAAADYDRDGRLDLYLCSYFYFQSEAQYRYPAPYHDARNGPPNFLFRNRLDQKPGYFEDVTAAAGMDHNNDRFTFASSWCDYDGDGWPDLFVTNDFGRKNLYRNTNGRFRDVAGEAGVEDIGPGMSAAWLDYDGDGRPDLLISNMWSACGQRIATDPAFGPVAKDPSLKEAYRGHVKGNSLYHNEGNGNFTYTGDTQGVEMGHWSWSCDGCDFDNDGAPEIYIACGMLTNDTATDLMSYFYRQVVAKSPVRYQPAPAYENGWNSINELIRQEYSWAGREPNVFYARRAGRYYDFSGVSGIDLAEDSRAFAFTDIDGDGNLDIVVKNRLGPQVRVFRNACGATRKAIVISLQGTKSNRDAIGARIEVDGQVKWLAAGSGFMSQHTKRLHFGLGDRERAAKVLVRWPSGAEQSLPPLDAGFCYEVVEGSSEIRAKPLQPRTQLPAGVAFEADNKGRLITTWLREPVPLPEKRRGPGLLVLCAGEPLPRLPVPVQPVDLRNVPPDLAAAYAIFRRYLFDRRADLETPLWLLIDSQGRVRKVYASAPGAKTAENDVRSADGPVPEPRAVPFEGRYYGHPARDYYKFGGALLAAGYPDQSVPYLEEVLSRNPNSAKALRALGLAHLQAKRLDQARQALERALAVDPRQAEAWNELGGVAYTAGNTSEALRCYQKALALAPELGYALLNTAQAHAKLGNVAEAERFYRSTLKVEPRNADAANGLGLLLAKRGESGEARKLFEQAIAAKRDNASAINNLGVLYLNLGQVNDAVAAFRYGIQVAPDDETLYLNLGRTYVRSGQREKARDIMRELLARKPASAVARKALDDLESR